MASLLDGPKDGLDDRSHAELHAYVSQKMYGLPNTVDIQGQEVKTTSPQRVFQSSRALSNFGAMNSLYIGNNRGEQFTSQWSNVWLTPSEFMFRDTSFASEVKRKEREERALMFNLERQRLNEKRMTDKLAKEALCDFYLQQYGVTVTTQQQFVLPPERLRELLIKKATDVMWDKAAFKI